VQALHDAKSFAEQHFEADEAGRELPKVRDAELRQRARTGSDEVLRAIDTGTLILPEVPINRLRQFVNGADEASRADIWPEYLEMYIGAARKCLSDIPKVARRDLRANRL
jgi:hypothetical protein